MTNPTRFAQTDRIRRGLRALALCAVLAGALFMIPESVARPSGGVGELTLDGQALESWLLTEPLELQLEIANREWTASIERSGSMEIRADEIRIALTLGITNGVGPQLSGDSAWVPRFDRVRGQWVLALIELAHPQAKLRWSAEGSPVQLPLRNRWSVRTGLGPLSDDSRELSLDAYVQQIRLSEDRLVLELGFQRTRSESISDQPPSE